MTELLEMIGFAVVAVASGEEALQVLSDQAFDVLLTDISLPGISGVELSHAARKILPNMRVIAASGYGDDQTASGAFDATLIKPYKLETLEKLLRRPST